MWLAIYCRRSVDPNDLGVSVHVQERNGRRYAAEHFPDLPVRVYVDNDLSAANPAVTRPAYQQLVTDVRAGNVAALVAREQSRLTRQPAEWEQLCTTLQLAGIQAVHQTHGGIVSVQEGSRLPGRIMAVVDAEYVEQVKVKVTAALAANAEDGRPHGRAGYGYRMTTGKDGRPALEPHPDTAPIAARMVQEIAAGHSLGSVAEGLNRDGIPTPLGGSSWNRASVRLIVSSHRLIGQRNHKGKITAAQWEPIVDRMTWERAQARLTRTKPGTTKDHRRQYLLTGGLAECGVCGFALISGTTGGNTKRLPAYLCPSKTITEGRSCAACVIVADRLEDRVVQVIGDWLTKPAFLDAANDLLRRGAVDTAPILGELQRIDSLLADLAVKWTTGEFNDVEHAAARRSLHEQRNAMMGQLAQSPVDELTLERLLVAWRRGGVERKALIRVIAKPVRVTGAFRDGRRLTVEQRVTVEPRWD